VALSRTCLPTAEVFTVVVRELRSCIILCKKSLGCTPALYSSSMYRVDALKHRWIRRLSRAKCPDLVPTTTFDKEQETLLSQSKWYYLLFIRLNTSLNIHNILISHILLCIEVNQNLSFILAPTVLKFPYTLPGGLPRIKLTTASLATWIFLKPPRICTF
jgi:hypothetical protein